jgi:ribosomal protein L11 methyltransferase
LLQQLPLYKQALKTSGILLLSGFYLSDLEDIKQTASDVGLTYQHHKVRNNWTMASFIG